MGYTLVSTVLFACCSGFSPGEAGGQQMNLVGPRGPPWPPPGSATAPSTYGFGIGQTDFKWLPSFYRPLAKYRAKLCLSECHCGPDCGEDLTASKSRPQVHIVVSGAEPWCRKAGLWKNNEERNLRERKGRKLARRLRKMVERGDGGGGAGGVL